MSAFLGPKQVWLGKIFALVRVMATSCLECFRSWQPCYLFGAELFFLSLHQHGEVQLAFINTNTLCSQQCRLLRWGITGSRWIRQIRAGMDVDPGSWRHRRGLLAWSAVWKRKHLAFVLQMLLLGLIALWLSLRRLYWWKEVFSVLLLLLEHLMCRYDWWLWGSWLSDLATWSVKRHLGLIQTWWSIIIYSSFSTKDGDRIYSFSPKIRGQVWCKHSS